MRQSRSHRAQIRPLGSASALGHLLWPMCGDQIELKVVCWLADFAVMLLGVGVLAVLNLKPPKWALGRDRGQANDDPSGTEAGNARPNSCCAAARLRLFVSDDRASYGQGLAFKGTNTLANAPHLVSLGLFRSRSGGGNQFEDSNKATREVRTDNSRSVVGLYL